MGLSRAKKEPEAADGEGILHVAGARLHAELQPVGEVLLVAPGALLAGREVRRGNLPEPVRVAEARQAGLAVEADVHLVVAVDVELEAGLRAPEVVAPASVEGDVVVDAAEQRHPRP